LQTVIGENAFQGERILRPGAAHPGAFEVKRRLDAEPKARLLFFFAPAATALPF
jgi:hypothetical protein